jgi:hypothetical protein
MDFLMGGPQNRKTVTRDVVGPFPPWLSSLELSVVSCTTIATDDEWSDGESDSDAIIELL